MAFIPVTRAPALPSRSGGLPDGPPSMFRSVVAHAETRGDDLAYVVQDGGKRRYRTWSQVAETVHRAGAGLARTGLRADQVVLSLLPAGHPWPELDFALEAIGAVVVQVSPHAGRDDVTRALQGVDVRLVVTDGAADLGRVRGLTHDAAPLLDLDGGPGWQRLLARGAERLVMDPDAVTHADRVVDPTHAGPRLLRAGAGLARLAPSVESGLDPDAVVVLVGDAADPTVQVVREAQVRAGCTLRHVAGVDGLAPEVLMLAPTVLALSAEAAAELDAFLNTSPAPSLLRRRSTRKRRQEAAALRAWLGGHLQLVVAPAVPDRAVRMLAEVGVEVLAPTRGLAAADLPVPPPLSRGDVAALPRRARHAPPPDFSIHLAKPPLEPALEPAPEHAPVLSPARFGVDPVLDRLLLRPAHERSIGLPGPVWTVTPPF